MNKSFEKEFKNDLNLGDYNRSKTLYFSNIDKKYKRKQDMTILERTIKRSITQNEEKDLDRMTLNSMEFSQIFEKFQEEKLNSDFINFEDLQPEYLKVQNVNFPSKDSFEKFINEKFDKEKINNLVEHILSLKVSIDIIINNQIISPFILINNLIEEYYDFEKEKIKDMENLKEKLNNFSYFRYLKKDNNSFYRAILFQIIEFIILNNKIDFLKYFIIDIYEKYSSSELLNYVKLLEIENLIKPKLILQIFISIYYNLIEKNIKKAYQIFVISINSCQTFDLGLIFYYKFILMKYIEENKMKHYSKQLNISIGSLLPEKYENNDTFLFDDFYKENLIQFNTDIQKIVFYITPYIFSVDLNIFSEKENKKFIFERNDNQLNLNLEINVFDNNESFELLYLNNYFEQFKYIFNTYLNKNEKPTQILDNKKEEIKKENIIEEKQNENIKEINYEKENMSEKEEINLNDVNIKEINNNQNMVVNNPDKKKIKSFENPKKRDTNRNIIIKNGMKKLFKKIFKKKEKKEELKESKYLKCENCLKFNSIEEINLCKECIRKLLYNESLSYYNECIMENIEFDINNILFTYKDKTYKIKKILPIIYENLTREQYQKSIKSQICASCQDYLNGKQNIIQFNCGCCYCNKECVKFIHGGKYYPFCNRCKSDLFQFKNLFSILKK